MNIVTVKNKFQIFIPQQVRYQVPNKIGDVLEAHVENGKITFTPKTLVDRHIAEGLEHLKHGRTHGPSNSRRQGQCAHRQFRSAWQ